MFAAAAAAAAARRGVLRGGVARAGTWWRGTGVAACLYATRMPGWRSSPRFMRSSEYKSDTFVSAHYRVNEADLFAYFDRKDLEYRVNPREVNLKLCPSCPPHKGKLENMWKLYFSRNTGAFFCHRCGAKGSWFDFKHRMGDVVAEASGLSGAAGGGGGRAGGGGPAGARRGPPKRPDKKLVHLYAQALPRFPDMLRKLSERRDGGRGLTLDTLRRYRVGAAMYPFQEDSGEWKDHLCITFPWLRVGDDGKEEAVRIKVRSMTEKACQRLDPAGGDWGLFGMHTVDAKDTSVVLTEGEYDAMAVHQATGLAAVSLPNGARSLPIEVLPQLERFDKIVLWMDDDVAGREGAEMFARKLGMERTYLVQSMRDEKGRGPKDANEALLQGVDMGAAVANAQRLPHKQILTFRELRDSVYSEFANPMQTRGVQYRWLPPLNQMLKGHRRGELTIVTGPTGVGKTTFLSQLSLDLCSQGVPTLWGSFEVKNTRLAKTMLSQFAGRNLTRHLNEFGVWANRFDTLPMYFLRFYGSTRVDQVLDAMEYAVYVNDVQHIILDNLQFMTSGQGVGFERFDHMDRAIEQFRKFASSKNVHISIVIHPRKQSDENLPLTTQSVFGTAKATQEADNVLIVQATKHDKWVDVAKNRFDGTCGSLKIRFDRDSQRMLTLEEFKAKQHAKNNSGGASGAGGAASGGGNSNAAKPNVSGQTPVPVSQYK